MIYARKSGVFKRLFGIYYSRLLKRHFYRIHLTGENSLSTRSPDYPTILYANHSNWWDGFIAYFLTSKLWNCDDYLMMDIEQLKRYSAFKYLGVFSIERASANETLKSINYAVSLLKNTNRYLWIFPQGKMEVQDFRPIEFLSGITKIAEKIGRVNLIPIAFRYEYIMEQRPEVFIKIGEPDVINNGQEIKKDFTNYLKGKLITELHVLRESVLNKNFLSFRTVFRGKESRNKALDKMN